MHLPSFVLLATLVASLPAATQAQQRAAPTPELLAQGPELTRFNLDFPGGTPAALAAAISKATGKHFNMIIPTSHADTPIMPLKVEGVTVPQLLSAIEASSRREVPRVTAVSGGQKKVEYKKVEMNFGIAGGDPVNNDTVWAFASSAPTREDEAILSALQQPAQVCQYFQLGPYLQDHTVEDITTAIQTGWKMLKVNPLPQLSFHHETKLLIAVGAAEYVAQIPEVLERLALDNSTAVEKIAKWQTELTDIETKKSGDWAKAAEEKRGQIERAAALQKARETIQSSGSPGPRRINSR